MRTLPRITAAVVLAAACGSSDGLVPGGAGADDLARGGAVTASSTHEGGAKWTAQNLTDGHRAHGTYRLQLGELEVY